ncbi:MAG: ATP-binding protein [Oscillospiraceae bacterium]|nr:ATP-binding protein [Oscillospiraceae bacterium]
MAMNIVINNLFGAAEDTYAPGEGDYIGEDGLWYCGKCHTPMQTRVNMLGEERTPFVPCRCRQAEIDTEEEQRRRHVREMQLMQARELCFSGSMLWKWNFVNCDDPKDPLMISMKNYCKNFPDIYNDGCGLTLYGPVGTGKTYAAACVANELLENGYSVHMTDFAHVINTLWDLKEGKQKYLDKLNGFDLLIIDDLAAERNTPYANEIVMNVIDSRCKSGKPLIITTNLTAGELFKPTEMSKQRIYSRLCEMCIPILCASKKDRRKEKMARNMKKYGETLMIGQH